MLVRCAVLFTVLPLALGLAACGETASTPKGASAAKGALPTAPSDALLEKLAEGLPSDGFDKRPGGRSSEGHFVASYLAKAANSKGVKLEVSVMVRPCTKRLCPKKGLTTASIKGYEPRLLHRKRWSMGHRGNDSKTETFTDLKVGGRDALSVWVESLVIKSASRSGLRGYHLYRSNGTSLIHVAVRPFGDIPLLTKPDEWRAAFSLADSKPHAEAFFAAVVKALEG